MTFPERLTELIDNATKGPVMRNDRHIYVDDGEQTRHIAVCGWNGEAELYEYLRNHAEAIRDLVVAAEKRTKHYECGDSWYSCPKSDGGCADEGQGTECNCGADEMIKALAKLEEK